MALGTRLQTTSHSYVQHVKNIKQPAITAANSYFLTMRFEIKIAKSHHITKNVNQGSYRTEVLRLAQGAFCCPFLPMRDLWMCGITPRKNISLEFY